MISKIFIIFLVLSAIMSWINENIWTGLILFGSFVVIRMIIKAIRGK